MIVKKEVSPDYQNLVNNFVIEASLDKLMKRFATIVVSITLVGSLVLAVKNPDFQYDFEKIALAGINALMVLTKEDKPKRVNQALTKEDKL